jgi:hypothetical protein
MLLRCKQESQKMVSNLGRAKLISITLRQEYVLLTGDYKKAILLEYFLSHPHSHSHSHSHSQDGWFNLSYETISTNSLLGFTATNLRKHIKYLVDNKWIERKSDETLKFASTFKYKVNKEKIEKDVEVLLKKKIE